MDIRCRKTTCLFNDRYTCKAKGILIGEKINCKTFAKSDKEEIETAETLFEKTPKYAPQRDSKTMSINCRADCLFNKSGKCVANGITLNEIKEKPFCVTYLKK